MDVSYLINKSSNKELFNNINKNIKKERKDFVIDEELIDKIYLEETIKFKWNNRPDHSIYERIKERTHLKSVSEFNDIFKKTIRQIIPDKLGKSGIDKDGCYALYLMENQFYILIQIDPDALINGYFINYWGVKIPYHLWVITVHNATTLKDYKYYKKINIDDSYFNV